MGSEISNFMDEVSPVNSINADEVLTVAGIILSQNITDKLFDEYKLPLYLMLFSFGTLSILHFLTLESLGLMNSSIQCGFLLALIVEKDTKFATFAMFANVFGMLFCFGCWVRCLIIIKDHFFSVNTNFRTISYLYAFEFMASLMTYMLLRIVLKEHDKNTMYPRNGLINTMPSNFSDIENISLLERKERFSGKPHRLISDESDDDDVHSSLRN